jgi:hypothetical protein
MKIYSSPQTQAADSPDEKIWAQLCAREFNLRWVKNQHTARTHYAGKPWLLELSQIEKTREGFFLQNDDGQQLLVARDKMFSVVDSTLKQLNKNVTREQSNPCFLYLQAEIEKYQRLADKDEYGFYVLYFDLCGAPLYLVQLPPLPLFKLSLYSSIGGLYRDRDYKLSWYTLRQLLCDTHILVAGASVAAATALAILGDLRPTYLTIGDPKPPNTTNFNRTPYNLHDVMSDESKVIAFARHVHAQDPTQILYLETAGLQMATLPNLVNTARAPRAPDLIIEAVDDVNIKIKLLKFAQQAQIPTIMLADVGSIAQTNFISPDDLAKKRGVVLGLSNEKLSQLLKLNFTMAAAMMTGLENAIHDEIGQFVKGDKNTPFGETVPQLGSTSQAVAALATESAIRYLITKKLDGARNFVWRRLTLDKKRLKLKRQKRQTLLAWGLNTVMQMKLQSDAK